MILSYNETLKVVGFSPFFLCLRSSNSLNFETKIPMFGSNGIAAFVGGPCFFSGNLGAKNGAFFVINPFGFPTKKNPKKAPAKQSLLMMFASLSALAVMVRSRIARDSTRVSWRRFEGLVSSLEFLKKSGEIP